MPSLLDMVTARQNERSESNYGIQTADRFAKTLLDCVGSDLCYRYASTKATSFDDVLKKAAQTLTYSNEDLVADDIYETAKAAKLVDQSTRREIELPKNTLMVFRNRLTTPRKDRDGDILRTKGARPDPNMLLLWQHVHTLPIGKSLGIAEHTSDNLDLYTAIVDINELAHDAAVMVENKMLRFSHGFKATEFEAIKERDGKPTGKGGFDVKSFDIMEESGVSVPANVDGEVVEVYLDLIESDKLSSSMMKAYGKRIRAEQKTTTVAGGLDLEELEKNRNDESQAKSAGDGGCGCGKPAGGCACSSEETKADVAEEGGEEGPAKEQKMKCSKCGGDAVDGTCTKCGNKETEKPRKASDVDPDDEEAEKSETKEPGMQKGACPKCGMLMKAGKCEKCGYIEEPEEKATEPEEKAGQMLSKANYAKLSDLSESLKELHEQHVSTRSGKALCDKCYRDVQDLISKSSYSGQTSVEGSEELTVQQMGVKFLSRASHEECVKMLEVLAAMTEIADTKEETKRFRKRILSGSM